MSANGSGPILPVVNIPVNYDEEREKIQDFLEHFKSRAAEVPSLPGEEPEEELVSETGEMALDDDGAAHAAPHAKGNVPVLKYMVQLVRGAARGRGADGAATDREPGPGHAGD
mgnify:FL=1